MTAKHADTIVEGYLKRLDDELSDLPSARRKEVSSQIAEHIAEARSALSDETDADVLTILDRLGEPDEIATEARSHFEVTPVRPGLIEILALIFLLAGPIVLPFPPVPWLAGAALVWRSQAWSAREKYYGVYAPFVAGLAVVVIAALTGGLLLGHLLFFGFFIAIVLTILLPIGSAAFLASQLRRRLPVLGWVAIAIICLMVYIPAVALYLPVQSTAFVGPTPDQPGIVQPAGAPTCGGFYANLDFAAHMPLVARVPVSVGICWDGQKVTKAWGPDCYPTYGLGLSVKAECSVTTEPDGSMLISVQATETSQTSLIGVRSYGTSWRITPDGHIEWFG